MDHANHKCGYMCNYLSVLVGLIILFTVAESAYTQVTRKYLPGENNTVEMIVHIIGQVQRPGDYRVQDGTNLIEILSTAGGPTEFSNLSAVIVAHADWDSLAARQDGTTNYEGTRILKYDIDKYLKEENVSPPPVLKPGDLVLVPKNQWGTWRNLATILRDISVVASAYFLYLRAIRD